MKSEDFPERLGKVILIILKPILKVSDWASNYTGFGAALVKPIPLIFMIIYVSYPAWSYPLWLMWALSATGLWPYVIFVLWLIQWPILISGMIFVGFYLSRKVKEVITYKDFKWDVDKSIKEYLELLEKHKTTKR